MGTNASALKSYKVCIWLECNYYALNEHTTATSTAHTYIVPFYRLDQQKF